MKNRHMRKSRYYIILGFMSCIFLMVSCQKEERELIDPGLDNTIPKDSQLAKLMKNIVTHDGSYDDIVDQGNCYSINLPYRIVLNSTEEIVIDEIEDYESLDQSDTIQIQFPITITGHDHVEKVIEDNQQLQFMSDTCKLDDDDIECVDFVYPFVFATFNRDTNTLNSIEVIHDAQVFGFMENLDENTVVALNYPIRLKLTNGEFLETTHNTELLSEIQLFETSCDENDG